MPTTRTVIRIAAFAIGVACLAALTTDAGARAQPNRQSRRPAYKVDPFWPKPLPNNEHASDRRHYVDRASHLGHQSPHGRAADELNAMTTLRGATAASDRRSWSSTRRARRQLLGRPGLSPGWPGRLQTIASTVTKTSTFLEHAGDSIIKFSRDGKFLWDFGTADQRFGDQVQQDNQQDSRVPTCIGSFDLDEDAREIFISDGFLNKRVLCRHG